MNLSNTLTTELSRCQQSFHLYCWYHLLQFHQSTEPTSRMRQLCLWPRTRVSMQWLSVELPSKTSSEGIAASIRNGKAYDMVWWAAVPGLFPQKLNHAWTQKWTRGWLSILGSEWWLLGPTLGPLWYWQNKRLRLMFPQLGSGVLVLETTHCYT